MKKTYLIKFYHYALDDIPEYTIEFFGTEEEADAIALKRIDKSDYILCYELEEK